MLLENDGEYGMNLLGE